MSETYYQRWQLEKFGNVLPEQKEISEEFENNANDDLPKIPTEIEKAEPALKSDN